jgi:hypothetical protein
MLLVDTNLLLAAIINNNFDDVRKNVTEKTWKLEVVNQMTFLDYLINNSSPERFLLIRLLLKARIIRQESFSNLQLEKFIENGFVKIAIEYFPIERLKKVAYAIAIHSNSDLTIFYDHLEVFHDPRLLYIAIGYCNLSIVKRIIQYGCCTINYTDLLGNLAFAHTLRRNKYTKDEQILADINELYYLLLDHGLSNMTPDENGNTIGTLIQHYQYEDLQYQLPFKKKALDPQHYYNRNFCQSELRDFPKLQQFKILIGIARKHKYDKENILETVSILKGLWHPDFNQLILIIETDYHSLFGFLNFII